MAAVDGAVAGPPPALARLAETGELVGHEGGVMCVRFNANGKYCLTGGRDKLVKLWNPSTQLLIKTYKAHSSDVNDVVASLDNSRFLSGSADKCLILWDVASGQIIRKIYGHTNRINCVRLNADCTVAYSGSYDATVKLWDLRAPSKDAMQTLSDAKDSVPTMDVTGHEILTGSVDGRARRYDIRAGRLSTDYLGEPVTSVSFSHDRNCILASTLDSTIRLLDKETGEMLQEYGGHKNTDFKIDSRLTYNDAYVVSGSENGSILMWDLVEGKKCMELVGHSTAVCSLSCHPKQVQILSASVDGTVKVWASPVSAL